MKEADIRDRSALKRYFQLAEEDVKHYFMDKSNFEIVPCVCCGEDNFKPQFEKTGFHYVLCGKCGTLYVNPRPAREDIRKFNIRSKASIFWMNEILIPTAESRRQMIFRPRAELVVNKIKISNRAVSMLGDIGAGNGLFLEEVKKILKDTALVAIEPATDMAKRCREKGFEVIEKVIEDIDGMEERFDFLSAFELLEHLHQPDILFKKIYKMLKPGGASLLTTLNCEGFDIQLLWERSKNIYPIQHINFFNPRSIRMALERNGLAVEEISTPGKLDWDIVEGMIKNEDLDISRFWKNLAYSDEKTAKAKLQEWISEQGLSSHMRVLARKPN